jgi:hypothetical protein
MSSGYSILPDGTVLRWTGRAGQRQQSERVGKIGDAEMHSLLAALYDLKPESLNHQETGNMTTALQIVSDDMLYTYTWPGTHGDNEAVPASIKPLRDLVWKHIQGALEK